MECKDDCLDHRCGAHHDSNRNILEWKIIFRGKAGEKNSFAPTKNTAQSPQDQAAPLIKKNGAYEIRTHGLNNANVARSQLRQCPIAVTIAQIARKCKVEICKKRLFYMMSRC